jgi:mRNA interferase MazF
MRRGEIRYVNLDPAEGAEAAKRRPAVIVSNDGANTRAAQLGHGVITVVPLTSNTTNVFAFQVLIEAGASGLPVDSKMQAEQIRSVSVRRIGKRVGSVDPRLMDELDAALRLHLGL